jgi:hypothetical protein
MATVEFVLVLEQRMELVPLRKGWWVAFGAPRQAVDVPRSAAPSREASAPQALATTPSPDRPAAPERGATPHGERGNRR